MLDMMHINGTFRYEGNSVCLHGPPRR
jgi:hypothetical protein